jgi:hypothetical protein
MSEKVEHFTPERTGPTDAEVAAAELVITNREAADDVAKAATLVKCTSQVATGKGCGALHPIKDLTYIQTHWYVSPYGCTGGGYWNEGEGAFVCPTCGHRNRLYASPAVEKLKPYFKTVEKEYDRR